MLPANLHRRGYKVQAATSGAQALNLAARRRPDAVILDMGLPDIDGFDVISGLRQWNTSPIIVLSARAAEAGKVAALDAGASDYVTRPCGMDEVLARLRAVLRDTRTSVDDQPVVKTNDFTFDLAHQQVIRGGRAIRLTRTEWQIVALLARHPNQPIPQQRFLSEFGASTRSTTTKCAFSWSPSGANSNQTRPIPVTSSQNPAAASGWCTPVPHGPPKAPEREHDWRRHDPDRRERLGGAVVKAVFTDQRRANLTRGPEFDIMLIDQPSV
jgi:two-component system KDP operon response regulator KdpE